MPTPATPGTPPKSFAENAEADYDAFSLAFDDIATDEATPKVQVVDQPATPDKPAATDPPAADAANPDAQIAAAEAAAATLPVGAAAADTAAAAGTEPVAAAVAVSDARDAKIAELSAAIEKLQKPAPAPVDAAPVKPIEYPAFQYSADEVAAMEQAKKDWPEVYRAVEAQMGAAQYNAVTHVFKQFNEVYAPLLRELKVRLDEVDSILVLNALRGQHADYDQVLDAVEKWVPTLSPAYRRGAEITLKEGTPEEVAALVTEYKNAHPTAAAAAVVPAAAAAAAAPATRSTNKVVPITDKAQQAASRLAATTSKRTATTAAADPNDFGGAWEEAIAAENAAAAK